MGLGNHVPQVYLTIMAGKIVQSFKTAKPGTESRTNKRGVLVHEMKYDHLDGVIVGISIKDHKDFGRFLVIKVADGEDSFILQTQFYGGNAAAFFKSLPNIDVTQKVKFVPFVNVVDGKEKSAFFLIQNGTTAKWAWTKDAPGDMPPLDKFMNKGKETWDSTKQMDWLFKTTMDRISGVIDKNLKASSFKDSAKDGDAATPPASHGTPSANEAPDWDDDLPF